MQCVLMCLYLSRFIIIIIMQTFVYFSHETYMQTINDLHDVFERFNFIQSHRNEQYSTSVYI